ncbi:MAG: hypothetical protein ACE5HS_04810 [bacterium]
MIILSFLIILGYAVNALMDGIAFSKSPQGRDLNTLWHLAKYVWVGVVLLTGVQLHRQFLTGEYLSIIVAVVISAGVGFLVWRITYRIYRKIDWPDWA